MIDWRLAIERCIPLSLCRLLIGFTVLGLGPLGPWVVCCFSTVNCITRFAGFWGVFVVVCCCFRVVFLLTVFCLASCVSCVQCV